MGRKRLLSAVRKQLSVSSELVIINQLKDLRAPLWRVIAGIFNGGIVKSWYKRKEQEIEKRVLAASKRVYRRSK